jgi:hypothetical protein
LRFIIYLPPKKLFVLVEKSALSRPDHACGRLCLSNATDVPKIENYRLSNTLLPVELIGWRAVVNFFDNYQGRPGFPAQQISAKLR